MDAMMRAQAVARILGDFVDFFEWVYEVAIPIAHRDVVQAEILNGWTDPDQSTRQLVTYVHELRSIVAKTPAGDRPSYRGQAQRIFRGAFSHLEPNGRGRVLGVLHRLLEQLRPGCTGVLPAIVPATAPPAAPSATLSPFQPPASPPPPITVPMVGATQPVQPIGVPQQHPVVGQPPQPVAPSPLPAAMQARMDVDTNEQNVAVDKYRWDSIHRSVMSIWR